MSDEREPISWTEALDSLAAQVDLQEDAVVRGHPAPPDLVIHPPSGPMSELERCRAIVLFERCEELLDLATARAVGPRRRPTAAYGGR